jgi:hypothetical protein
LVGFTFTDELAREQGLDIECDGFARQLWEATHQSFTLCRVEDVSPVL